MMKAVCFLLVALCVSVHADLYMHYPRGSNNRLNENTATRNNNNRLFDSQNNNRGGYNVADSTDQASQNQAQQYSPTYYEGSRLEVTWTNQHGCGGGDTPNPKMRCEIIVQAMCDEGLRNGQNTGTPNENDNDQNTGRHETAAYYSACKNDIQRNQGLWTADQNLNGDTAIYTRQNPNGGRSGLECPEERDYYPWWNPNPWRSLAVMTYNMSQVEARYQPHNDATQPGLAVRYLPAPWSRQNHLGNGLEPRQNNVELTMPSTEALCGANDECKCVLRMRYNMSIGDVPWDIDSTFNGEMSPVQQNPTVRVLNQGLKLAINTAQTGRTFQDRSHIWYLKKRPAGVPGNAVIRNLNVQGKRGNIVQTYPAVEYDFVPNRLEVGRNEYVHIQVEGSNTHNNNPPGGDGQTGDAGEGTGGTDRHNIVEIRSLGVNYPVQYSQTTMWTNVARSIPARSPADLALEMATNGAGAGVDELLNNAPASGDHGLLQWKSGTYYYMCTRNNNFSNRSQKGTIVVE